MLRTARGPLRGEHLLEFKRRVIASPAVMAMVSLDVSDELCTLFHHAAAGPAHSNHLVEWFIQMGALDLQPPHFRNPECVDASESVYNTLAVRSAAKRGYGPIVQHILEADSFRDIDTLTYHTKESLVHLAVKGGHRHIWQMLYLYGANIIGTDTSGKHVWELTTIPDWREDIKWRVRQAQAKEKDTLLLSAVHARDLKL